MAEKWRGLHYGNADYSDKYEVSNLGRLRRSDTHRVLKTNIHSGGYLGYCASLGQRGKNKMFKIHRAVAENFIPNPNNYPIVNHLDGDKFNNCVDNLEWCTHQQNIEHAHKMGLSASREVAIHAQPHRKAVKGVNLKTGEIVEFPSIMEAARELGSLDKHSHITRAVRGERKTAYGYRWELINTETDKG